VAIGGTEASGARQVHTLDLEGAQTLDLEGEGA
jgi:hypothetical protein